MPSEEDCAARLSLGPQRAAVPCRCVPEEQSKNGDGLPAGEGQCYLKSNLTFSFSLSRKLLPLPLCRPGSRAPGERDPGPPGRRVWPAGKLACPVRMARRSPRVRLEKPQLESEREERRGRRLRDWATTCPAVCARVKSQKRCHQNKFERPEAASRGRDRGRWLRARLSWGAGELGSRCTANNSQSETAVLPLSARLSGGRAKAQPRASWTPDGPVQAAGSESQGRIRKKGLAAGELWRVFFFFF